MKPLSVSILLVLFLISACGRDPLGDPEISLTDFTACKGMVLKSATDHPTTEDCLSYRWTAGDSLILKHTNAGFNCCPEGFGIDLTVSGDTLIIAERENSSLCDCNCLYDLHYVLTGISRSVWWIRVVEPYVRPGQGPLLFQVDLKKQSAGEFCTTRNGYPWGT